MNESGTSNPIGQPPVAGAFKELLSSFRHAGWAGWTNKFWESLLASRKEVHHTAQLARKRKLRGMPLLGDNGRPANPAGVAAQLSQRFTSKKEQLLFLPSKLLLRRRLEAIGLMLPAYLKGALLQHCGQNPKDKLGIEHLKAFLLPLLVYSSDTAFMCELFQRMKTLGRLRCPTRASVQECLGPYAGISVGIVESCQVLRNAITESGEAHHRMWRFFMDSRENVSVPNHGLAARALWVPSNFNETALSGVLQHYNFASFSLSIDGAMDVLTTYRDMVPRENTCALLLVARREDVLGIGFPIGAFYSESKVDKGASIVEEELVLPPFAFFEPVRTLPVVLPVSQLRHDSVVQKLSAAWGTPIRELDEQVKDLVTTWTCGGYPRCLRDSAACRTSSQRCPRMCGRCAPLRCVHCHKLYCARGWKLHSKDYLSEEEVRHAKVVFVQQIHASWL